MVVSNTDIFLQLQRNCLNVTLPMIALYLKKKKKNFSPKLGQNSTAQMQATPVRGTDEWPACHLDDPTS